MSVFEKATKKRVFVVAAMAILFAFAVQQSPFADEGLEGREYYEWYPNGPPHKIVWDRDSYGYTTYFNLPEFFIRNDLPYVWTDVRWATPWQYGFLGGRPCRGRYRPNPWHLYDMTMGRYQIQSIEYKEGGGRYWDFWIWPNERDGVLEIGRLGGANVMTFGPLDTSGPPDYDSGFGYAPWNPNYTDYFHYDIRENDYSDIGVPWDNGILITPFFQWYNYGNDTWQDENEGYWANYYFWEEAYWFPYYTQNPNGDTVLHTRVDGMSPMIWANWPASDTLTFFETLPGEDSPFLRTSVYIGPVSQQSSIYLWHYQEEQLAAIGEYTEFMEQWTAGKDATGYFRENAASYRIYYVDDPTSDDPLRLVPEEPFF